MTYRVAADVLAHLLPIDAEEDPWRHCVAIRCGLREQLSDAASDQPAAAVAAITVSLDLDLHPQPRGEGERHLEVRVGNVEDRRRRTTGVRSRSRRLDTDITALIRRNLETVGRNRRHRGDRIYRRLSRSAVYPGKCRELTKPPILDWFHIAMRLQLRKAGRQRIVDPDDPDRVQAKAMMRRRSERLRWRIWNGKAEECSAQHRSDPQEHACLQG